MLNIFVINWHAFWLYDCRPRDSRSIGRFKNNETKIKKKEADMKKIIAAITFLAAVIFAGNALAQSSIGHSGTSLTHSGQSVKHSVQAVGHGSLAGAKLTSGALAIPFKVAGSVSTATGHISNQMSEDLWHTASGQPFKLTDQNFIKAGVPPHQAILD
jgi:hypothetical protein